MAVAITSAQRSEPLLEALAAWLADVPDDPFETDLVIVPNVGVRDWLTAELGGRLGSTGHGDGVVANIRFSFTDWLNAEALDLTDQLDPRWLPERLPWTMLAVLHRTPDLMPGFRDSDRPLALARHAADLIDRYTAHRPAMLRSWLADDGSGDHDGTDEALPLDDDHRWQAAVFRAVRAEIGHPSRAELLDGLAARIADRSNRGLLPRRLALFGLGSLTPSQAEVLEALSPHCAIRFLAQLPSRPEGTDHPLLRGWGGSAIPTRTLLGSLGTFEHVAGPVDRPDSLLSRLQMAIDADAARPRVRLDDDDGAVGGGDGSIQVHACHGATRQVEALRDALLHLIAADPTLTAQDVLVVCPDIQRFAPLVKPVLAEVFDRPGVPVSLADRGLARLNPVAAALEALFDFATGRAHVGDLFSLLGDPAVRTATRLDQEDLDAVDRWTGALHVRWGLDAAHRTRWGYPPDLTPGTWLDAADRLLAGVLVQAPTPVEVVGGLAPFDDVDGSEGLTVGRLARTIEVLREFSDACAADHLLAEWCDLLEGLVGDLVHLDDDASWQVDRFRRVLDDLRTNAELVAEVPISAREASALVTSLLGREAATTRLRTGSVTVASPAPLRGVPARVVAVLGFDDQSIRPPTADGDDLLHLRPRPGERDSLLDHRRMLLDLVLAARHHLIVTCDSRDVTSGQDVPLSGHLVHLLEAARSEAAVTGGGDLPILVRHSRQLADRSNLGPAPTEPSRLADNGPWTHDPGARRVAAALDAPAVDETPWSLPPEGPGDPGFDEAANGVGHPARALLRDRLGVSLPALPGEAATEVDLWSGPLEESDLGRELLKALAHGTTADRWRADRRLIGGLPPGRLGESVLDQVESEVQALVAAAGGHLLGRDSLRGTASNPGGPTAPHGTHLDVRFTRWHDSLHLLPWLRLARLTLDDPSVDWEYRIVTRGRKSNAPPVVVVRRMAGEPDDRLAHAREVLETVTDLGRRARLDAVPLFRRLSWTLFTVKDQTTQKNDLKRDLLDRWTAWLHAGTTLDSLRKDVDAHPADAGLPEAGYRAARYAEALAGTWARTTTEPPDGTA